MQRVNEFSFYELAQHIHPFSSLAGPVRLSAVWLTWWYARQALDSIFTLRPLNVCASAGYALRAAITEVIPEKWEDVMAAYTADLENEKAIPPWNIASIQRAAQQFETVLAAECQVLDTYFVSKKGTFSTADLIEHAHFHFPPKFRPLLPDLTKGDIDQAGKCIAFDLPTAAAFHLLRGTEAVLREYYDRVVPGKKRASAKMRNWGAYIRLMNEHGADPKIISLVDHLRDSYRNPVLHPEENYTEERAQVLFGVCVSAIVMMLEEIEQLDAKGQLLPLTASTASLTA